MADSLVSPDEFEAMSQGKTMHFQRGGKVYGSEQFYKGRQSLWQFADGECEHGRWYADGNYICFVYELNPTPQCWHFLRRDDGSFAARAEGATEEFDILLDFIDEEPLDCKGPSVGA